MAVRIDRPKSPKDVIGRTMWLSQWRGREYAERVGGLDVPLLVVDRYRAIRVCKSPDGREHHILAEALSLLSPADQIVAKAERDKLTGGGR